MKTKIIIVLFLLMFGTFVYAQTPDNYATKDDIADIKMSISELSNNLQNYNQDTAQLKVIVEAFIKNYSGEINRQTDILLRNMTSNFSEMDDTVVSQTDPFRINIGMIFFIIACMCGVAFVFASYKGKNFAVKWMNRHNILCVCGNYAKYNKEKNTYSCKKCERLFKLIKGKK